MPINFKNWRRAVLLFMAAVIALLTLGAIVHHYQLKSAVDNYRAELKAKGALKQVSELRPPPVPLDQDRSGTFFEALSGMHFGGVVYSGRPMDIVAPGKAIIAAREDRVSWDEIQEQIKSNKASLELLGRMVERPKVDFHIPYESGLYGNGSVSWRSAVLLLIGAAMSDLHKGDVSAAVKQARAALCVLKIAENQRFLLVEQWRFFTVMDLQALTWEILQSGKASDADLAALQKDWEQLEFLRGHDTIVAMEYARARITLEACRDSMTEVYRFVRDINPSRRDEHAWLKKILFPGRVFVWRYWSSYPDELCTLKAVEIVKETVLYAETNAGFGMALKQQQARLGVLGLPTSTFEEDQFSYIKTMFSNSAVWGSESLRKVMFVETLKCLTTTAIALERYKSAHGEYPATMAELAPEFVRSVPLDPVDAKPLRYKLNPGGTFLLYSLAENGVDDGGDPCDAYGSFYRLERGRDWLWPQPATPEQVRKWQIWLQNGK